MRDHDAKRQGAGEAAIEPSSAGAGEKSHRRKGRFHVPTAFTILFAVTIVAAIATYLVPAGAYSKLSYDSDSGKLQITAPSGKVTEEPATQKTLKSMGVKIDISQFKNGSITKPISVPNTYKRLPQNPQGVTQVFQAMVNGTIEGVDVIVFILVLGGLIGTVRATGAFESGILALTKKTKGREFAIVFFCSLFMVIGGTTIGFEEEAVAFYPILTPVFIALGYDSIVTVGAIFLSSSVGTTFSTINPFSSVIASNAAGIVFTEGLAWRMAGCVVAAICLFVYLHWYASKVKADPTFSYSYEDKDKFDAMWSVSDGEAGVPDFTLKRRIILILFVMVFPIMVYGVMKLDWWFPQMAAFFLFDAVLIMFIAGFGKNHMGEKQLTEAFSNGSSSLVGVSLIIGLARGVNYIMNQGLISDTVLFASSKLVSGMSGPAFILVMIAIFFVLGFIVPSSSGLAVLSMPILAPLADTVGIPRWIIVMAYQFGQYAMLYLAPTGLVMATLQMLDMQYSHWLKFVWPVVAFTLVFGGGLCIACSVIYAV